MHETQKNAARRGRVRRRRLLMITAAGLSVVSLLAALVMVIRSLHIVNGAEPMLLPMLTTMCGLAGAFAKTAGWLGGW